MEPPTEADRLNEELSLTCPACEGKLRMRRQHFGVQGSCVHCQVPLLAEEGPDGMGRMVRCDRDPELPERRETSRGTPAALVRPTEPPVSSPPAPDLHEQTVKPVEAPKPSTEGLFSAKPASSESDSLFTGKQSEPALSSGWGTKVPSENHASISPFATGSANRKSGFGDSLFAGKSDSDDSGASEKKSDSAFSAGGLFASIAPEVPKTVTKATPVEQTQAPLPDSQSAQPDLESPVENGADAIDWSASSGKRGKSRFVKKLVLFLFTLLFVAIGYGGYRFLPTETTDQWKAVVVEWLEPGSVLLDYIPFLDKRPDGAGSGSASSTKAVQEDSGFSVDKIIGLDKLTERMGEYREGAIGQIEQ